MANEVSDWVFQSLKFRCMGHFFLEPLLNCVGKVPQEVLKPCNGTNGYSLRYIQILHEIINEGIMRGIYFSAFNCNAVSLHSQFMVSKDFFVSGMHYVRRKN